MAQDGLLTARRDTTLVALDSQGNAQHTFFLAESWVSRIDYAMTEGAPAYENVRLSASEADRETPS
jgi:hypothetical protein